LSFLRLLIVRDSISLVDPWDAVLSLSGEPEEHIKGLYTILRSNWLPILWLAVILGVTLVPLEATDGAPPILCVLCGDGALADGVLNAALFLPLGTALSVAGWRPWRTIGLGALLSCGVETAQFVIPGRDPSLSDVLFNTLGTALGIALARSASTWWRPPPRLAQVLSISGSIGATSVLALTGVLLGPSFSNATYYGGWTPRFGHLEWYGGRLLEASLDGLEVPSGVVTRSADVRQLLLSGATIHVRARAGPRPAGLAPLLTIHDRHQREILLLGVDGDDFVYRYRTRAIAYGFIGPEIRVVGALRGIASSDPLSIVVRQDPSGHCVRVNATEHCGLGYTVGIAWALLLGGPSVAPWHKSVLNVVWLAALFFPLGLWARCGRLFVATAAFSLGSLLILPAIVGLLPTPGVELLGAFVGFLAGWASSPRSF
jgi:hypothetical protein